MLLFLTFLIAYEFRVERPGYVLKLPTKAFLFRWHSKRFLDNNSGFAEMIQERHCRLQSHKLSFALPIVTNVWWNVRAECIFPTQAPTNMRTHYNLLFSNGCLWFRTPLAQLANRIILNWFNARICLNVIQLTIFEADTDLKYVTNVTLVRSLKNLVSKWIW